MSSKILYIASIYYNTFFLLTLQVSHLSLSFIPFNKLVQKVKIAIYSIIIIIQTFHYYKRLCILYLLPARHTIIIIFIVINIYISCLNHTNILDCYQECN